MTLRWLLDAVLLAVLSLMTVLFFVELALAQQVGHAGQSADQSAAAASPGDGSIPPICSSRDLEVSMALEVHGLADDVAVDELSADESRLIAARILCSGGHVAEAVTVYDEICRSLNPRRAVTLTQ
jgi:hypothetical protein